MKEVKLNFTDAAFKHILSVLKKTPNGGGFRLAIKRSGCSGLMYLADIVEQGNPDDIRLLVQNELLVFVAADAAPMVDGTEVDVVIKELGQNQLVFRNPRMKSQCGCGESFSMDDPAE